MTRSRDGAASSSGVVENGTSVDAETAAAVARVAAYGDTVAHREFEDAVTRLESERELTARERAVLSALSARIVGRVLPTGSAIRDADVDAATVRELFAD